MLLEVVTVRPQPDFTLLLQFDNGERGCFDMSPYLERKPFFRIKTLPLSMLARIEYRTVARAGDIDITPETLCDRSEPA